MNIVHISIISTHALIPHNLASGQVSSAICDLGQAKKPSTVAKRGATWINKGRKGQQSEKKTHLWINKCFHSKKSFHLNQPFTQPPDKPEDRTKGLGSFEASHLNGHQLWSHRVQLETSCIQTWGIFFWHIATNLRVVLTRARWLYRNWWNIVWDMDRRDRRGEMRGLGNRRGDGGGA